MGFVGSVMYTESITDRYFGYCKALMEHGIEVRQDWVIRDRDYSDGVIGIEYKLQLPKEMPTAFVCNNDVTAYALIRQLEERNYHAEMSKIALSCVIRRIENVSMNASVHIVNGRIIERTSVKKIN